MSEVKSFDELLNEDKVNFKKISKLLSSIDKEYESVILNFIKKGKNIKEEDVINHMTTELDVEQPIVIKELLKTLISDKKVTLNKQGVYKIK
jgi:hypothetical protein